MSNLVDPQRDRRSAPDLSAEVRAFRRSAAAKRRTQQLRKLFMRGLKIDVSESRRSGDIESGPYQPRGQGAAPAGARLLEAGAARLRRSTPDFFVLNTAQFAANTLNNNEVIRAVDAFVARARKSVLRSASPAKRPERSHSLQLCRTGTLNGQFTNLLRTRVVLCRSAVRDRRGHQDLAFLAHHARLHAGSQRCNIGQNVVISPGCTHRRQRQDSEQRVHLYRRRCSRTTSSAGLRRSSPT